ncbi:MAG: hypothetical protein K2X47_14935 [Bdellovibrionales bacterium]|nr:hypothetical protein [Bdellovibrionales bacterium]
MKPPATAFRNLYSLWKTSIKATHESRQNKAVLRAPNLPLKSQAYAYPDLLDLFFHFRPLAFPPTYQDFLMTLGGKGSFENAVRELVLDLAPESGTEIKQLRTIGNAK